MFKQLEVAVMAIQLIAAALVFIACLCASACAVLVCIMSTWRRSTHDRVRVLVKGPTSQGGQSTGWLESSGQGQG